MVSVETPLEVARAVDRAGTIARGLGRSYGDLAQLSGGRVIGTPRLNRFLSFDESSGVLCCEAGVTLEQILHTFAPRGWFPQVTPGTKQVTVGGCIANDVHGKAHHHQGAFNRCVSSFRVLLASGEVVTTSRSENTELFWGSFGGLGLLGVILEVTLSLRRIETTYFCQRSVRCASLDALLDAMEVNDPPYLVANVDLTATGASLGRGLLTVGDHACAAELPSSFQQEPLRVFGPPWLKVPGGMPALALNPFTAAAINWVRDQRALRADEVMHAEPFFYQLDAIAAWNRGYGPHGFAQYQFAIPRAAGRQRLRALLEVIVSSGNQPFLSVLKRLGPAEEGPLSFPLEGYTLAVDLPIRLGTEALTRRLDAMVIEAGGRVYLAKDSFLEASSLAAMYPRVDEWRALKARFDPSNTFQSDLARRTGLVR